MTSDQSKLNRCIQVPLSWLVQQCRKYVAWVPVAACSPLCRAGANKMPAAPTTKDTNPVILSAAKNLVTARLLWSTKILRFAQDDNDRKADNS